MDLNRISKGQLGTAIARIFGLVDENAVGTVAPELMPTTSPWERDEFWALTGGNLMVGSTTQAAVAGQAGAIQLKNPAGSGMIIILERVVCWPGAAGIMFHGMNLTSLLSGTSDLDNSCHRDARRAPNNNVLRGRAGVLGVITSAALTVPQQGRTAHTAANQAQEINETWVFPPGWAWQVAMTDFNVAVTATFYWREKPISDSEQLTF